jgi:transporter family protein
VNWLAFSLMATGLWGVWGFLSKVATRQLPPQAVYLLAICGHGVVLGYLCLGGGMTLPWQPWGLTVGLAAGVSMAFGLLCFFKALAGGEAAVVVPLTALYPLVTVILSLVVLQETITPRQWVGVALALAAVWLLAK